MALTTGPETDGTVTQLDEEAAYLAELADLPRAAVDEVGTSTQGRPIRLVRIGHPAPADLAASRAPLFIIATQHGDERSCRETVLALARDLAQSSDPDIVAYLTEHSVLLMPTPNPDAWAAASRTTPAGVNMNRAHLDLEIPEAVTVARILRDAAPHIGLDVHESMGGGNGDNGQVGAGGPAPNVHPSIRALNVHLQGVTIGALRASGQTASTYEHATATGELPGVLDNAFSHRHALGLILEMKTADPLLTRIANTRTLINAVIGWHAANASLVAAATEFSRRAKEQEGATQSRPFDLKGAGFRQIAPPATGYRLTPQQLATAQPFLDAHGVLVENGVVWAHQHAQPLIPYLLDPQSDDQVVAAERIYETPYPHRFEWWTGSRWRETVAVAADEQALTPEGLA